MGGLGWVGSRPLLVANPRSARHLPCGTRLGGRTRVSGHKAYRTVDCPQTPWWRSRVGDATVPVCMCPCLSEGGGGRAVAHMARGSVCLVLQAPAGRLESLTLSPPGEMWAWARNLHVTRNKLPNCSTAACWHGKAVVRGTTGVRPALLDCLRHRWCCHAGWVRLPTAEGVPRAGGGAPRRRECFPAQGAARS